MFPDYCVNYVPGRTSGVNEAGEAAWTYGACDVAMDQSVGGLACNIEVSIDDAQIRLDGLTVSTSESILANGDFRYTDLPPAGEKPNSMPRDWRRTILPDAPAPQCDGAFAVEDVGGERTLTVSKGEGSFILSATPAAIPSEGGNSARRSIVARASLKSSAMPAPEIVLRQYGTHGLLREDRSPAPARAHDGATLVSTGGLPCASDANRLLLMLVFPQEAGTWQIRSVELVPLVEARSAVQVYADQVGYDTPGPVRFIAASTVFPVNGAGTFVLKNGAQAAYQGSLIPAGRAEGEHGADWGSYYFAGIVNDAAPGSYVLEAKIGGVQAAGVAVYVGSRLHQRETAELAYRFFSVQRCGCEVPGWHGPCHMDDAKLPDGRHVDVSGGFHNAGDMHKHMGDNTPVAVYGMVHAYESDPAFFDAQDRDGNGRADILDEAVWGAEWMRKMVDPATGRSWLNITNDIDYYGTPEHDTDGIPGNRDDRVINTTDPSDFGAYNIAAWAVLGRRLDAPVYLDAARKLWAVYEDRILAAYEPRQVIAALELYRSTNEAEYLSMAGRLAGKLLDLQNAAGWYARTPGGTPELKIVDEGVTPAALACFALANPASLSNGRIRDSLRAYFAWSFRLADNPFGLLRSNTGGEPFYFKARDDWFGGCNSEYLSTAWAANLAASLFQDEPAFVARLRSHAVNQLHWILGMNPMDLCMFEGKGTSERIYYHHLYAGILGHERGAVPGAIPNGIIRPPDNSDRPWFELKTGVGGPPGAESAEPWLPHNAYYLLTLSSLDR